MNIHEYQAKKLLATYDIPVPYGQVIRSREDLDTLKNDFKTSSIVVKAQIHSGGRGKGHFTDGLKGGVKVTSSLEEAKTIALKMLGNTLITAQTGPQGRRVQTVYLNECSKIKQEFYLAFLLDRAKSKPALILSKEGGTEIEILFKKNPSKIRKIEIDPFLGLLPYQVRQAGFFLELNEIAFKSLNQLLPKLWQLYTEKDMTLLEINPLILTLEDTLMALDAKMTFDDNALFRQKEIALLHDYNEEHPLETKASQHNLNYIALDGNIACLVNGAGLAMATMDSIQFYGGQPANFLDLGGGVKEEQVSVALQILSNDPKVKGIIINIFGGIVKCDIIAKGLLAAIQKSPLTVPLVIRFEGTNSEQAKTLLKESGIPMSLAKDLPDAVQTMIKLLS